MKPETRLERIAQIIESIDDRCLASDGPVTETRLEMTPEEMKDIYRLAKGNPERRVGQYRRQQRCKNVEELTQVGLARGYKHPELWANHIVRARAARKA